MLQIRPSCRQHWRISIFPTATPRIIWRTRNSCHVPIASSDTLLHVGVWCKSRPRRVFLKVSEKLEITETHIAKKPCDWLRCYGWEIMDHAAYSPDLAPRAFHYFGPLKTKLVGKRFATDTEVKQAVTSWLQTIGTDLWYVGETSFGVRSDQCSNVNEEYLEVWACTMYTSKFSASKCVT